MSVSQPLGKSLEARSGWCQPNEPIVWTFPQTSLRYDVEGLDIEGNPLPGWGKRTGKNAKRAASAVGGSILVGGLTAAFGGGDDAGGNVHKKAGSELPDVIVFGGSPDSKAARLLSRDEVARLPDPSETSLDRVRADWVLTSHRLSLVIPAENRGETGARQERKSSPGLIARAKSLTEKTAEDFGANRPGEPLQCGQPKSFFDVHRGNIIGFDLPLRELDAEFQRGFCLRVVLDDNSGFDFHGRGSEPHNMMEMTMGRA